MNLARSLNLTIVAEGVEALDQANLLRTLGRPRAGLLFAQPAGAAEIDAQLAKEDTRYVVA
jgi:EAL domain-containing protein (putative c-di-GMP-specific phosphodiesterase class I)